MATEPEGKGVITSWAGVHDSTCHLYKTWVRREVAVEQLCVCESHNRASLSYLVIGALRPPGRADKHLSTQGSANTR